MFFKSDYKSIPASFGSSIKAGTVFISTEMLIAFIIAVGISSVFLCVIKYTDTGRALRAISDDRAASKLMGLPVAAVRGGGVVQSIVEGEDGFLTENNPAALANAALQLIQNPSLHNEYAKKARHNAERDLTAKSIVKKTSELYASLIK